MNHSSCTLVSIIILSYNSEKHIDKAIKSSINQTHTNIEIIIADDASTDDTLSIIQQYIHTSQKKIRLISNKSNIGITKNWFNAVSAAKGDYITAVAADDEIPNNKVAIQLSAMAQDPNIVISYTDALIYNQLTHKTYKFSEVTPTKSGNVYVALSDALYYSPTVMFKKKYSPKKNIFSTIKHASDLAFLKETMILSFPEGKIEYIPKVLYKYKIHENNITKQRALIYKEHIKSIKILQQHYPKFHVHLNPCIYDFCCTAFLRFSFSGNFKLSKYFFIEGIKAANYNPFKFFRALSWKINKNSIQGNCMKFLISR
jgi:glycosyltransferase involved in cell wall biosynthesis